MYCSQRDTRRALRLFCFAHGPQQVFRLEQFQIAEPATMLAVMLHELIGLYRDAILVRARDKVKTRAWAAASSDELATGVPLFLTQLGELLRLAESGPTDDATIAASATAHGRNLSALGFTVGQVVHDYGDVCQAITEIALESGAPISVGEFHTLNRCLDTAIAGAVTEHTRLSSEAQAAVDTERAARSAHELRDLLNTALLAFNAIKIGPVAVTGSTGAVLGRSLLGLRNEIDKSIAQSRLAGSALSMEPVGLGRLLDDVAEPARLAAEYRHVSFVIEPADRTVWLRADPLILASAIMNLLTNAIKFTPANGRVTLRTRTESDHLLIDVEDQCGGFPETAGDPFEPFVRRRSTDQAGLGLGLSIARKAVRAHGGDITLRNQPGHGCLFGIRLPLGVPSQPAGRPATV